jgi:hypothetical protein
MKLNLGSGHDRREGYINVDKYKDCSPDILADLEQLPWDWCLSGIVEEVVLRHVLEHLGATSDTFCGIMRELYRVTVSGARILVTVPHPRSDSFLSDPTHVRAIMPGTLALFSKKWNRHTLAQGWANTPLAQIHDVDFNIEYTTFNLNPPWDALSGGSAEERAQVKQAIDERANVVAEIEIALRRV